MKHVEGIYLITEKLLVSIEKHCLGGITKQKRTCNISFFIREIHKRIKTAYPIKLFSVAYLSVVEKILKNTHKKKQFVKKIIASDQGLVSHIKTPNFPRVLLIASLLIASKILDDCHKDNESWAKTLSLSLNKLNTGELIFLLLIDYKTCVSSEVASILKKVSLSEAKGFLIK